VARRFVDLVERQLALFAQEQAGLMGDAEAALAAYNRAPREEAEERYGDYLDLVETATDELAALRDAYASSLDGEAADEYGLVFNDLVRRRLPQFGLELD
jgi:hypothetical protein